jgi:ribosomal protein S12 methylthiotransferase
MNNHTFYIESLGCSKNQVDSEVMIASLCKEGFLYTEEPENASIIIINTCGFIASAIEESIVTSLEFKTRFPEKKVFVAGCLTERYADELRREMPEMDGFIGNKMAAEAGVLLKALLESGDGVGNPAGLHTIVPGGNGEVPERTRFLSFPGSAYVKIAEGCNNCCTYCAIPLIRGRLKSRDIDTIANEARLLLAKGMKELILVSQDTGSFGRDREEKGDIIALIHTLLAIDAPFWLRLLYIHPDRFPDQLLAIGEQDPRFLPYFDIPFQHASAGVLSRMGRTGNREIYLDLIRRIRSRIPRAVIRSTFLTGFPGETDEDFQVLIDFQEKAEIDWLGVFTYSREEGTPAFSFPDQVKEQTAVKRKKILEQNQLGITEKRLARHVGTYLDVLIEEPVINEPMYLGRSYIQAPEVDGLVVVNSESLTPGDIVRVRILRQNHLDLEGVVV